MAALGTRFIDPAIGKSSDIHTTQQNPLGYIARGTDGSEWIYVSGVASAALGVVATYTSAYAAVLITHATPSAGPVGVFDAAVVAANWGWLNITGVNPNVSCDVVAGAGPLYIDGTAGRVDDDVVAGDLIVGMTSTAAGASNVVSALLNRPWVSGGKLG